MEARTGEQFYVAQGFVYLHVAGEREVYTVHVEREFRDGQVYTRTAESVLGGNHRRVTFRWMA